MLGEKQSGPSVGPYLEMKVTKDLFSEILLQSSLKAPFNNGPPVNNDGPPNR